MGIRKDVNRIMALLRFQLIKNKYTLKVSVTFVLYTCKISGK